MPRICLSVLLFFGGFCLSAKTNLLVPDSIVTQTTTDSLVAFAKSFLGTNYCYGAASPKKGFDCSGFTWYVYNHFGISVPRSARDYKKFGTEVKIEDAKKGDIIVFRGTHVGDRSAGHVGIVISNPGESLQFIHSSSSKKHCGVVITEYYSSNYPKRFIQIVRVIN